MNYSELLTNETPKMSFRYEAANDIQISIGVITHDRPYYLDTMLKALEPQIVPAVEVVVVVDGYDEATFEVLNKYKHLPLRVFFNKQNEGRPKARNRVVKEARGEYIIWIDDDDIPLNGLIQTHLNLIESKPDIDVAYVQLEHFDEDRNAFLPLINAPDVSGMGSSFLENLFCGKGIPSIGSLIRRSLYLDVGGFDDRFLKAQDTDFWFRIALKARFYKIHQPLYRYTRHANSITISTKHDYSYLSFAIRNALRRHSLEEIFPSLNWRDPKGALASALRFIAKGLMHIGDIYYANKFFQFVPLDYMNSEEITYYLRTSIALRNIVHVHGMLISLQSIKPGIPNEIMSFLWKKVIDAEKLESKIKITFEEKEYLAMRPLIKELRAIGGTSLFMLDLYSKRFIEIGDVKRAKQCLEASLRFAPDDDSVFQDLIGLCKDESECEEVFKLRDRMRGEEPGSPLYYLSSLQRLGMAR